MEKLRRNITAKISAYILMIAMILICFISAAVVAVNVESEAYSSGRAAVKDGLCADTADAAQYKLSDKINTYIVPEYTEDENRNRDALREGFKAYEDEELLTGESDSAKFGYIITENSDDADGSGNEVILRSVNQEIIDQSNGDSFISVSRMHDYYTVRVYVSQDCTSGELPDEISQFNYILNRLYELRIIAALIMIISFLAVIFLFLFLIRSIGVNSSSDSFNERRAFALRKIPLDLAALAAGLLILLPFYIEFYYSDENLDVVIAVMMFAVIFCSVVATLYILLFAARVKLGKWWQSTICYQLFRLARWILYKMKSGFRLVPVVWKTAVILAAGLVINLIQMVNFYWYGGVVTFTWVVCAAAFSAVVIHTAAGMKKLKAGAEHLANGDLDFKIDKKGLYLDFAEHADALNSIGEGMERAIAGKLQSERFKNELITNVSHDLKTPLTSIINYVDLLKKEELDNEKAAEYIEVLDRQSKRLQKLTEDVVEASKAATGNVKLEMMPCHIGTLMSQIMGEYKEKAEEKGLKLILDIPERDPVITADGKSMWRVLNNLMSNICKYSQTGTRVYQTLKIKDEKVVLTYKNTSAYELNISEEELMERFVRGDSSRHTEGSGLGLSIAQNLVELQGGSFGIYIDGDLFKVTMEFSRTDKNY